MTELRFDGQVAIVTGGGRGLGRLYAMDLARRGASVLVNDLGGSSRGDGADASVADLVVAEIRAEGGIAAASGDSVGTPEGGQAIVDAALERFGRVDIVINNAGIIAFTPFDQVAPDEWHKTLNVHLDGSFHVSQPAFRQMKKQDYGRFVFISSTFGAFGQMGAASYATAKAGLLGLSNVIALEGAAHGIRSNVVLPVGFSRMVTDQESGGPVPPGRQAFYDAIRPELITPLVVFLASRDCALNHRAIAACAGRYSRVFSGYGEGWLSEAGSTPSAEDMAARIAQLDSTDGFFVPESSVDETIAVCRQRGIDLSQMQ
ncbi:NAD(P)-dependent dehydrogenase, short-chain alcohol dehydrogenase family [Novosphingobium sp. CF614]|uniref:SDR family NAD(P)-dependent oxidoreductase n=1 Tax=Novosphingobium sp. CF614 TaxID=1884364 RepID=UPI0008F01EFB|nr:SDR family NAD(P)-dependent oxidoreductase [Novosphingobium sp. CF614]SFG46897.1 NAD(P)-dependent dehydrogenase, short-chain alcohol dehydrogenase family [Novosphingobium sp. CF614]